MRNFVLGLDVSTTTVGWSLLSLDSTEVKLGYVPLGSYETLLQKSRAVQDELLRLSSTFKIVHIFIEEDLRRFTRGKSSATTLQTLSRFNGMVTLLCFQVWNLEAKHLNVNNARKSVGCKVDKDDKTRSTKDQVVEWAETEHLLENFPWPTHLILRGPRRGEIVRRKEVGDMCDAYVVSKAGLLTLSGEVPLTPVV